MPNLDLEPVLDLEPIEESEPIPEERPPRGTVPSDFTTPPEIPAPIPGEIPEEGGGIPPRLTPEEWDRATKRAQLQQEMGIERLAGETIAGGERAVNLAQEGIVSPAVAEGLLGMQTLPIAPGIRKSIGEAASGLTSPVNLGLMAATGGATAVPKIGGAIARGVAGGFATDIATHMPELGTAAGTAVGVGTPEEAQKALTDVALSAGMGGLAGAGVFHRAPIPPTMPPEAPVLTRAPVPPEFVKALEQADNIGLTRSAQAAADSVKLSQRQQAAAAVRELQQPAETTTEVPSASSQPIPESSTQREIRTRLGEETPLRQSGETAEALPPSEAPVAREPARAQNGPQPEVPLEEKFAALDAMTPDEMKAYRGTKGSGPTGFTHEIGSQAKTPEDVAMLKREAEASRAKGMDLMKSGDLQAAMDELAKQKAEAYEYATGVTLEGVPKWTTFEKIDPAYKPAVPDAKYIAEKTKPETVTLYQGQEGGSGGGSYWSTNLERAKLYGGNVSKVEVPRDVFEAGQKAREASGSGTSGDAILPNEWANKSKPFAEPPAAAPVAETPAQKAAAAAALRAAPTGKKLGPRAAGQRFNDLIAEWGEKLGWTTRGDLISGIVKERTGLSGASVKGTMAGKKELSLARRAALDELGLSKDEVNPSQLQKALPKLEALIGKWQLDEEALQSVPMEKIPEGSEFTIHGKKWKAFGTDPETEMVKLKGPAGQTMEVDMRGDVRIDPDSLKGEVKPFEMEEGKAPTAFRKRGSNETLSEYAKAKREALGIEPKPYEQSLDELQRITDENRRLMEKAKEEKNESAYTFYRAKVLKGEQWIKYQTDNPIAAKVPKLMKEEKGTGDLLKHVEEPIQLAAEEGVDVDKALQEKADMEKAKKEAAALQAKQQLELPGTATEAAKKIADKLRDQFKTDTGGSLFTGPVEIINAAVELVARTIEAGGKFADAIAAGVKYIKERYDGEFDAADFEKRMRDNITASINPQAGELPGKRSQVYGVGGIGHEYSPESLANARAWTKFEVFDGDRPVSEAVTAEANKLIDDWLNPETSKATGESILKSTDSVLGYGVAQSELFRYALKLAGEGDIKMIDRLIEGVNRMEMPGVDTMSEAGRALRGRAFFENPAWQTYAEAYKERKGIIDAIVPDRKAVTDAVDKAKTSDADKAGIEKSVEGASKQDIARAQNEADSILAKYAKSQSDTLSWRRKNWNTIREAFKGLMNGDVTEAEFRASLEGSKVEGGTIDALVGVANRELNILEQNRIAGNREALQARTQELWKQELERNQKTAENMLKTLEQQNAGAEWVKPSNRTRVQELVKAAYNAAEPILADQEPWIKELRTQLENAGVDSKTADALARNIAQAREKAWVNARERQNSKAAQSPNVSALIDAIEGEPISNRTDPNWRKDAEIDFFLRHGLSREQANRAQATFDKELSQRWTEARVKAAERALKALPVWQRIEKSHPTRARSNLERIRHAIRAELTNPNIDWETALAKENGWKGFSEAQHKRMSELDSVLADPQTDPHQRVKATNEMMDIARNVKIPPTRMAAIAEGYAASMFSGLPTVNVNVFAPPLVMLRNLFTELATNPAGAGAAFKAFGESMKSLKPEFEWAWLNDAYAMHTAEYLKQSGALKSMMEEGLVDLKEGRGARGAAKVFYGAQQYVFRTLSSLDQAWRTAERQYKTALFGSKALKSAGYSRDAIAKLTEGAVALKRLAYEDAIARGMTERDAQVRSHDAILDAWWDGLAEKTDATTARDVSAAAQRESDMIAGLKSENIGEREEGMISQPFNKFMEYFSHGLVDSNPFIRLGTRMMFGVVNVPFRALRYGANFSPYGLVRYAVHKGREAGGKDTFWKQSFGNEAQARQRLAEGIIGTATTMLLPLLATATSEDTEDKKFGIFVTGKGPDASDKIVRDAWLKKFRPYSVIVKSGDKYGYLPLGRIGESVMFATGVQGALDDYYLKAKHNAGVRKPKDLEASIEFLGNYLQTMSQRGIFSTFKRLGDIGTSRSGKPLADAAGAAAYTAGPLVPYKGMMDTATRLFTDPIDRSNVTGAILSSTPIAGGIIGKPAINALGDPIDDRTVFGKAIREGLPVAIKVRDSSSPAYDLILKFGQGPTTPTRYQTESIYGALSNEQWYQLNLRAGREMKKYMEENAKDLGTLDARTFNETLTTVSQGLRSAAADEIGLQPKPTP